MNKLNTKIFLDSANPEETIEAIKILGYLDGQTTNPSLFAKTQELVLSENELWENYFKNLSEIKKLIPNGSISAEIYADNSSTVENMYQQAQKILNFDRQLHVKLPTCTNGIKTLDRLLKDGVNVNMTLGFDQNQALAVSQTAINSQKNQVYFSCFVGRLFDNGIDGIENLVNIKSMFEELNTPVQLLACSFRNLDQFLAALAIEVDIVTVSIELLREWKKHEFLIPKLDSFHFKEQKQTFLPIIELDSDKVNNPLTLSGMNKFASDWNKKIS